jgi:hypothetical protein
MSFTPESIALSLFTAVVAGLGSYVGFYVKAKAELRAAKEDLKDYISNQIELTSAVENEKLKVAIAGALAVEARQCIYALIAALQSLLHSMCWLAWDATNRKVVRKELAVLYDSEAHKGSPEIMARQTLLFRLDPPLYQRSKQMIDMLWALDVRFGEAIVLSEKDESAAVSLLSGLLHETLALKSQLDDAFATN